MMFQSGLMMLCAVFAVAINTSGQIVTLESPTQWLSLRSDSLAIKIQVDTTQIAKKNIKLNLVAVIAKKTKNLASQTVSANTNFIDMVLKFKGYDFVGGKDFLRLDWSVAGKSDKGTIAPFGLAKVDSVDLASLIRIRTVEAASDCKAVLTKLSDNDYRVITSGGCAFVWSAKGLFVAFKKASTNSIVLAIDGKNGKNAFTAYADRYLTYVGASDSVSASYYNRFFHTDSLTYTRMNWHHEFSTVNDTAVFIVMVPWSDLGVIPSKGRMIGLALFEDDATGKNIGALPKNASMFIPGSWADAILE